ncbi:SRPBCC family protein [Actinotalea ferrariae]|uniref:SRPBCC family protein n=1 Tax=Actinotalea ferrariae TaxID=1386098 RepID=UPI001C8C24CD|nr:SRPBCC family protein [Actinotalea ferrariae]MBX9243367.1 SRPBCC family protein [Actinotalea ferrariae]
MTTTTRETTVTADPDVPLVRVVREFDAPPEKVFRAHTDPDLLVQWFGPRGTETRYEQFDATTGGTYRCVHVSEGQEMGAQGCFHEVRAPESIVQTFSLDAFPDGVALERYTFERLEGDRTRLTVTTLVDSFETRDQIVASGMEHGVREGFERLDDLLAS